MVRCNRRDFFVKTGGIFGAAVLGGYIPGCAPETANEKAGESRGSTTAGQWNGFTYAMCNESLQDHPWAKQCEIIGNAGYNGVEIASFTLVNQFGVKGVQDISAEKRKEMRKAMDDAGITCAGLHWLLAPPPKGLHFTTPDKTVRSHTVDYLDKLIDFCGDLGGGAMIFGSPKQRNTINISVEEANKHFADGLAAVADHAKARKVKILLEPLSSDQTDVVNTLAEAMEIVKTVDHPSIRTMFDFHNTADETEPHDVLIKKYFDNIRHIHVQEMDGDYLGTGTAVNDYVKAFQTMKDMNYKGWVSLEVFNFEPEGTVIAEESMKILKKIEGKLT